MAAVNCPACQNVMQIEEQESNVEWECPTCAAGFVIRRSDGGSLKCIITSEGQDVSRGVGAGPSTPSMPAHDPTIPDAVYVEALESLLKGTRPREIRKGLIKAGYSVPQAEAILRTAVEFQRNKEDRERAMPNSGGKSGTQNMVVGGIICLVGIVITFGTLSMASGPRGGTYTIAWGAIVFGGLQFCRGFIQSKGS